MEKKQAVRYCLFFNTGRGVFRQMKSRLRDLLNEGGFLFAGRASVWYNEYNVHKKTIQTTNLLIDLERYQLWKF